MVKSIRFRECKLKHEATKWKKVWKWGDWSGKIGTILAGKNPIILVLMCQSPDEHPTSLDISGRMEGPSSGVAGRF